MRLPGINDSKLRWFVALCGAGALHAVLLGLIISAAYLLGLTGPSLAILTGIAALIWLWLMVPL